jgi:lipopolysaccharide export system protein LptC
MKTTKQVFWLLGLLLSLVGLGWYVANPQTTPRLDEQILSQIPDIIIHDLVVQQFDVSGQQIHYLETPLLRHKPLQNVHLLQNPHIIVKQPHQPAWEITALEATTLNGAQQITFSKNVIIHQKKDLKSPETVVKTEEIIYFPQKKLATTEKNIIVTQADNVVRSTGMQAYLAENRVKLLSNARGTYVSNRG